MRFVCRSKICWVLQSLQFCCHNVDIRKSLLSLCWLQTNSESEFPFFDLSAWLLHNLLIRRTPVSANFLFIRDFFLLSPLSHSLGTHAWTAGPHTNKTHTHSVTVCITNQPSTCPLPDCSSLRPKDYVEDQDVMELVPNIILNPGFMEMDPIRPREPLASSIIKSTECPGPGKPRRVWFSSILNLRIFYRTDSGLLSWSWATHDRTVVVDKSVNVWTITNREVSSVAWTICCCIHQS